MKGLFKLVKRFGDQYTDPQRVAMTKVVGLKKHRALVPIPHKSPAAVRRQSAIYRAGVDVKKAFGASTPIKSARAPYTKADKAADAAYNKAFSADVKKDLAAKGLVMSADGKTILKAAPKREKHVGGKGGQFAHSSLDNMCVCGHHLGDHLAAKPRPCDDSCGCPKFRKAKSK